jgi:hypothetical protein
MPILAPHIGNLSFWKISTATSTATSTAKHMPQAMLDFGRAS